LVCSFSFAEFEVAHKQFIMIRTLAIGNYRSLLDLIIPLTQLNVVTGPNGSGKSNLYKALRLLAETANGGVINALAKEGGLESAFWAGPETISRQMKSGDAATQGGRRKAPVRLRLGFSGEDFGYAVTMGLPPPPDGDDPNPSKFSLDPEIKKEVIWAGDACRPASCLIDRSGPAVKFREGRRWQVLSQRLNNFESMLDQVSDPENVPEIFHMREDINAWRFYDHFRTDKDAPARHSQIGTRTPILSSDGNDLAAALQTIIEIGDIDALDEAIDNAFPGARLQIDVDSKSRFSVEFYQNGLLRPLSGTELSDGTLRYLLLVAALLTPRPPALMVLNEPETSLHPDLLPALAKLIIKASEHTQVWVVSHANRLVSALESSQECNSLHLEKELGQSMLYGQSMLDTPSWHWPD
jgi:predicted ATPase